MSKCEAIVATTWGPNEGCREFMTEPEEWRCGEPAVATIDVVGGRTATCTAHVKELLDSLECEACGKRVQRYEDHAGDCPLAEFDSPAYLAYVEAAYEAHLAEQH